VTSEEPGPVGSWDWDQGAASQQGGRHEQQDCWGIFQSPDRRGLLATVADGMGGHLDGALGARTIIETAREFARNPPPLLRADPSAALDQLCQQMHDAVNDRSEAARSTIIMVWLQHDRAYWLNVGDSRLYHFRNGRRLMRTRDHSAVQLLMDLGEINEAQMATHPAQNRLYRSLGGEDRPKPDHGQFAVEPGDLLALCSDGIWEHVPEVEVWNVAHARGPAVAARLLAEQAVRRGGAAADNATLVLLRAGASAADDSAHWLRRLSAGFAALFNRNRH
jgi:PPM family protein phosphatase